MRNTSKIFAALLAAVLIISCFAVAGCGQKNDPVAVGGTSKEAQSQVSLTGEYKKPYEGSADTVEIDVKDFGKITVKLDRSVAPISVQNFLTLVNEGFYDGLTFHRIISGFMIQGGDPDGNGTGGSKTTIKGEFAQNGVTNSLSHKRGVISMARSTDPDSASSQFFIVHKDSTFLDGQYAAFGEVTSGMEVVDKIAESAKVEDSNGTVLPANQPVINSIKIVE
jgi:peptidyl-prolyl cis-trans isomerase B (cyclophilin B)